MKRMSERDKGKRKTKSMGDRATDLVEGRGKSKLSDGASSPSVWCRPCKSCQLGTLSCAYGEVNSMVRSTKGLSLVGVLGRKLVARGRGGWVINW